MRILSSFAIILAAAAPAHAGPDAFTKGPAIADYGPAADVAGAAAYPEGTVYRIAFDVSKRADEGGLNRTLEAAARFLNMHARAGGAPDAASLAVVVHGQAVNDVATATAGANAGLVKALAEKGVRVIVCGQSAAYYDVAAADLLPGVELMTSAMLAHATLQQAGYTLNPF